MNCPSCSASLPENSRFCPQCGADLGAPTLPPSSDSQPPRRPPSSSDSFQGRYAPGEVLAGRYRIVSLLGRGGMGEVYRADDLKLEQPVALKLLPEALAIDPLRLAHFHDEVRIARQVSHRNVCRVYDIDEVGGQHFLTMEYVDGEDLSSLLRRIGRLPKAKGIEIARQLCAGLAAAHEKGFIHRDLKPANIMIDGRGVVRIMDFGLAALADTAQGPAIAGTPAYMAPEQLTGQPATVRSDLYALGLVLHELFTGRPVHTGKTLAEIKRQHRESAPVQPSTIIEDIDPAVERVILNCLESAPELRPLSALAVAAGLPGGDPLAAAIAAGETPSPEMVAAAGVQSAMKPLAGWLCLAGVGLAILLCAFITHHGSLLRRVPLEKPPAVLVDRARQIITDLGYDDPAIDDAHGFGGNGRLLRYVSRHDSSLTRWDNEAVMQRAAIYFWYREAPSLLVPSASTGRVTREDPPMELAGMRRVYLDPSGRLIYFDAVPPQFEEPAAEATEPDWAALFRAADLAIEDFAPDAPTRIPPVYCDSRAAWEGCYPGDPETPLRVEAAAYRGQPVFFRLHGPWSGQGGTRPSLRARGIAVAQVINVIFVVVAIVGSTLIVRRNLRAGQGDRRGGLRVALFVFGASMLSWLLSAHHVSRPNIELNLFVSGTGEPLFFAVLLWLLYMALEPTMRRRWPTRIVSWSRLLTGRFRDPLVGRDVLVGTLLGSISLLVVRLAQVVPVWFHRPPPPPETNGIEVIASFSLVLAALTRAQVISVLNALFFFFLPLLLFIVVRRIWIAAGIFWITLFAMFVLSTPDPLLTFLPGALMTGTWVFIAMRMGLLASAAGFFAFFALSALPITADTSAWYFGSSLVGIAIVLGLAAYGLRLALRR